MKTILHTNPDGSTVLVKMGFAAIIDEGVTLGQDVCIMPFAHVMRGATVGEGSVIGWLATVGRHASVGAGSRIGGNALICTGAMLGAQCRVDRWATVGVGEQIAAKSVVRAIKTLWPQSTESGGITTSPLSRTARHSAMWARARAKELTRA